MNSKAKVSILFVCMGNICRSPTAEGVFRHFVTEAGLEDQIRMDSAGTHAYHVGEPPDRRAVKAAKARGYSLDGIAARRVRTEDFETFDYIFAMDEDNLQHLRDESPEFDNPAIRLFLDYENSEQLEVPDPYYGGAAGFERVLDLIEAASRAWLATLQEESQPT